MTAFDPAAGDTTVVMDAATMHDLTQRLAQEIAAAHEDADALCLLGILTRGVPLAGRIAREIGALRGVTPPVGTLATTFYRDDVRSGQSSAMKVGSYTHFDFSLDGRVVILVDDVLAAGRTIRAAMDEVFDYGRPARIQLACLIDRGGRELPIQPDYLGWRVATAPDDWVAVRMTEHDGEDAVFLQPGARHPADGAAESTDE